MHHKKDDLTAENTFKKFKSGLLYTIVAVIMVHQEGLFLECRSWDCSLLVSGSETLFHLRLHQR
jgi:hypothetical protein